MNAAAIAVAAVALFAGGLLAGQVLLVVAAGALGAAAVALGLWGLATDHHHDQEDRDASPR